MVLPPSVNAPVLATEPTVSLKPFRSSRPVLALSCTTDVSAIWLDWSRRTMSLFAPPTPSPMVRLPPMASVPAVLFKSIWPEFTVVRPLNVFAVVVPARVCVPVPFLLMKPVPVIAPEKVWLLAFP